MSKAHGWTTIFASLTVVAACSAPPSIPGPPEESPLSTGSGTHPPVSDPIGQNGSNGLEPAIYLDNRVTLDHFMAQPLTPSGDVLDPRIQQFIAGGIPGDRRQLVQYAADCALPFGSYDQLEQSDAGALLFAGSPVPGAGLLQNGADWPTTGLNAWQQMAVNTCLITRLNPSGTHVSIWLNGIDVNHAGYASDGGFEYVEGHWLTLPSPINLIGPDGIAVEQAMRLVWPSPQWLSACGADVHRLTQDAKTRVCGKAADSDDCGVAVAPDGWCTETATNSGIWTCTIPTTVSSDFPPNLHAIETRLQPNDWVSLHAACAKP